MAKSSEDEQEWMDDLEASVLMNDANNASDVSRICKGKPINENLRHLAWQKCLDINRGIFNAPLSEIFDLPEQKLLRHDCHQFVANLGNEDEDKVSVISDLETILTTYRKISNITYESGNGWLELLLPLLALKRPQNETYALLAAIRTQYIPNGCAHKNGDPFHLFRLLLLYHDPELCSFLDTKKLTPEFYCRSWTLFAANCNLSVVQAMWDVYFQQVEPFYLFFLSLVMVINAKEQIMGSESSSKDILIEMLSNMPSQLEVDDVPDFCGLAHYYALKTPSSFRKDLRERMFGDEAIHNLLHETLKNSSSSSTLTSPMDEKILVLPQGISQALCLPVCAAELVESVSSSASGAPLPNQSDGSDGLIVETVRFFLVDCRPADQYNSGHLPTAFHLDSNLMLQEPAAFATAVQGLLSARRQAQAAGSAAAGDHLCFLGSGRNEEDQYTHMVVASFLQKHTVHVSMLTGGYEAVHEYLDDTLSENLEHHNSGSCLVCKSKSTNQIEPSTAQTPTVDIFSKLSAAVSKLKTSEVKGKLLDYIVNPAGSTAKPAVERHVRANDKLGRRYRNVAPVFSIDDDQEFDSANVPANEDEGTDEEGKREIVSITQWIKENFVTATFPCQEYKVNNMFYDSILALSESYMYVLRVVPGRKGYAQVVARRSLSSVVKITSRRKHPNMITFKYGVSQDDDLVISDMDRLLIPNSTEAMKTVTKQIVHYLKTQEG